MDDFEHSVAGHAWESASREPRTLRDISREALFGGKTLKQIERAAVEYALECTAGNKSAAARALQIPIATFKRMLKRYQQEDSTSV